MGRRILKMVFLGIKEYKDPYYQGVAAQLAYFFMLSIVPTLIVLSQLLGIMDISLDFIEGWIRKYVESDMARALQYLVDYKPVASTNIVLIITALWAASRIQFGLTRITDYTYSGGTQIGSFWRDRVRAMLTLIITIISMALMIVLFVYGELIVKTLMGMVIDGSIMDKMITVFRWPVAGGLYFLMVSINYYVLPTKRLKYREILPGSIFTAIGMLVVTIFYSVYANHAVNYDLIYGSLASIIALLIWFYFISWVLCLGILVNKVWMDTKGEYDKDVV